MTNNEFLSKINKDFKQDDKVFIDIPNSLSFHGKIVGIAHDQLHKTYIIECTDNFIPNSTYPYTNVIIPSCYINLK